MNYDALKINQKMNEHRRTGTDQWKMLNDDGRNGIDKSELRNNLRIMNIDTSASVADTMMDMCDLNRNGVIDKREFDKFKTNNQYRPLDSFGEKPANVIGQPIGTDTHFNNHKNTSHKQSNRNRNRTHERTRDSLAFDMKQELYKQSNGEQYNRLNTNMRNGVDKKELVVGIRNMNIAKPMKVAAHIMKNHDKNGDRVLQKTEFDDFKEHGHRSKTWTTENQTYGNWY